MATPPTPGRSGPVPAPVTWAVSRLARRHPAARFALPVLQRALANPEVRARVQATSTQLVQKAREWQAQRQSDGNGVVDQITGRFGAEGLSRRLLRVRESIEIIRGDQPLGADASDIYSELLAECDRLDKAIQVATGASLTVRLRGYREIDGRLKVLEDAILQRALDDPAP